MLHYHNFKVKDIIKLMNSLVIFVHGLGADNYNWWGSTKDQILINEQLKKQGITSIFFNYVTDKFTAPTNSFLNIFGGGKVLAKLDDIGGELVSEIEKLTNQNKYNQIKLFGHSMGGIIIAAALFKLKNDSSKVNIFASISDIALCGTPLGGSNVANIADTIFKLATSKHTKKLRTDSHELTQIVNNFTTCVSLKKDHNLPFLKFFRITNDQVVKLDEERYGPFLTDIDVNIRTYELSGDHCGAVQNLNPREKEFNSIISWIKEKKYKKENNQKPRKKKNKQNDLSKQIKYNKVNLEKLQLEKYAKKEIFSLAKKISKITNLKLVVDDLLDESINYVKDKWTSREAKLQDILHITKESYFTTTICSSGQVILTRKIKFQMMQSGEFIFKHYFIPYDKSLDVSDYKKKDDRNCRWSGKSFKFNIKNLSKGTEHKIQNFVKKEPDPDNPEIEWITFTFNCPRIEKDHEFEIELSISDLIPKEDIDSPILVNRINDYFTASFAKPHALRHIKFQIENYENKNHEKLEMIPTIKIGNDNLYLRPEEDETVYYHTWSWDLYYVHHKDEDVKMNLTNYKILAKN